MKVGVVQSFFPLSLKKLKSVCARARVCVRVHVSVCVHCLCHRPKPRDKCMKCYCGGAGPAPEEVLGFDSALTRNAL